MYYTVIKAEWFFCRLIQEVCRDRKRNCFFQTLTGHVLERQFFTFQNPGQQFEGTTWAHKAFESGCRVSLKWVRHTPTAVRIFWTLQNTFGLVQILFDQNVTLHYPSAKSAVSNHLPIRATSQQHYDKRDSKQAGGIYIVKQQLQVLPITQWLEPIHQAYEEQNLWLVQSSPKRLKMTRLAASHDRHPRI